jgi:hypothetical protein
MRKLAALLVFLGLLCGQAHATCSGGTLPNNLTNGTIADASQVMANYNAIISSVNATCAGSGTNADITSLTGLTTALTALQGGTNTWIANGASGGSANAQTVTTSTPSTSFSLTKGFSVTFAPGFANTGATTLAVNGTTATAICQRVVASGACNALTGGELNTGIWTTVTYDGTSYELVSNQLVPGWGLSFTMTGSGNIVSQSVAAPARSCEAPIYANLSVTVASSNLTVTLNNGAGSTPSAAAPVLICFPNATGGQTWATATVSTTFVANSGSSFGATSGKATRYWVVAFNNGGVINIGVYQATVFAGTGLVSGGAVVAINEIGGAVSTTACNACTNATGAQTYYSTTALTNTTAKILGYFEASEATAGTWTTTPTPIQLWAPGMKKAGDIVQSKHTTTGGNITVNITPFSAADAVKHQGGCEGFNTSANQQLGVTLQQAGSNVSNNYTTNAPNASASNSITTPALVYFPQVNTATNFGAVSTGMTTTSFCDVTLEEIFSALEPANDNEPLRLAG